MTFPKPFYRWRPHPWHGLSAGEQAPQVVTAYIEITPFDLVKYEVDKETGYLKVDRPQRSSNHPPALYGFIPRTFCGRRVKSLSPKAERGDGDPLDICVLSERPISQAEILLQARVVGGLQMVDQGEADDKIIAILEKDNVWGQVQNLEELPPALVDRLTHYFSTYKLIPGQEGTTSIETVYGREAALAVVEASMADYNEEFGD